MWPVIVLVCMISPEISLASEQCGAPPKPANGQLSSNRSVYDHRDVVQFTCESEYELYGENVLTCNNGEWTGRSPVCLRNIVYGYKLWFGGGNCTGRQIQQGGKAQHTMCDMNETVFFDVFFNETTDRAFIFFRGNITAKDKHNNSVPLIQKTLVFTQDPEPSNFVKCPTSPSGGFDCISSTPFGGAKIEVTLKEPQTFNSIKPVDIELHMEKNGFVVASYSDAEVNCGTPPAPLNGFVSVTSPTEAKYECKPGYVLSGKAIRQCDTSKYPEIAWPRSPLCLVDSGTFNVSHIILIAVMIVVGCVIAILTVVGVAWCYKKRWGKKQVAPPMVPLANLGPSGNSQNGGSDMGCETSSCFPTMPTLPPTVQYPLVVSQNYSPSEYSSLSNYQNLQSLYANAPTENVYSTIDDSDKTYLKAISPK